VRRADWISHCLARAVCAAYWFHPLVWIAWRRFALEAERSCDDAVLRRSDATAYADQLVALAQRMSLTTRAMTAKSPLLAMANRADLATRVGAVLDHRQRRGRAGTFFVAISCAGAVMLVLVVSPLKMVAAFQATGTSAGTEARTQVSVAPTPAPVAIAAEPQAPATPVTTPMARFFSQTLHVIVNVTVSDKNGNPIDGLRAGDFLVTEDGVPQSIKVFEFHGLSQTTTGAQSSLSGRYMLGYFTTNSNLDGAYRNIRITGKQDTMAKLDFGSGYYARSPDVAGGPAQGDADLSAAEPQAPGTPASAQARFFSRTMLVIVDVTVHDKSGNPIEGLSANDFVLTEDGVPQRIMVLEFQKFAATTSLQSSLSSYYILGYYSRNQNLDGKYRQIEITGKNDAIAKLDYRHGYRATSPNVAGGDAQPDADRGAALDPAQPILITKIEPEYSEEARKAKWQGTVQVDVVVDENGVPIDLKISRALGLGLDQKAMEAVWKWRFKPATKDGKPVTSQTHVDVEFRLF
jgi:TonB family protein